jgi:hypothetical protein
MSDQKLEQEIPKLLTFPAQFSFVRDCAIAMCRGVYGNYPSDSTVQLFPSSEVINDNVPKILVE